MIRWTPRLWERVEALLLAVSDLAPGERSAFLERSCAGDRELRGEVESLLTSEDSTDGFLEKPLMALPGAPAPGLGPGSRLGGYRILGPLGSGGMGAVYLAAGLGRHRPRRVAIKLLKDARLRDDLRRCRLERRILARLCHPNIARLLGRGTTEHGSPYLIMEYVDGEPIDRYCQTRGLALRERLEIICKVCSAVHCSHRNGVLHRDLKPSNILVGAAGEPKLLDFGAAKLRESSWSEASSKAEGRAPLTMDYASPEQLRDEALSPACDVYALGVVLYELVTGRSPYRPVRSLAEKLEQICDGQPETSGLEHGLAGDLGRIVFKALEKEPGRRFASAELLAEDLRRHLEGRPIRARQTRYLERLWELVRR